MESPDAVKSFNSALAHMYPSMQQPSPAASEPPAQPADPAAPAQPAAQPSTAPSQQPPQTEAEAAKRLFPGMEEQTTPAPNSTIPEAVKALRESDPGRRMFSPQKGPLASVITAENLFAEVTDGQITGEIRQAAAAELREIATDIGANRQEVETFLSIRKDILGNPPTPEQSEKWRAESVQLIRSRYGDAAESTLALGEKLMLRDPRVAKLIIDGRMQGHPRVVSLMCELATREAQRGRLK
ncbi:MAG: hypothetical protein BroJett006_09480 [Betaproteobacteria bacterium]|nr:MAG: hypothetical protein BroJett006_09480 [Betaproteobacteria bacterium]